MVLIYMPKYNEKKLPYETQDKLMDAFCVMLFSLKSWKQIKDFLKDLLNRKERTMLIRRLLIAAMLVEGYTYADICARLKCGKGTVSRVERWLNFGRGGYRKAIKALKIKF